MYNQSTYTGTMNGTPSVPYKYVSSFLRANLKGLSYEIDFENVDENWQILALTWAAVGF